MYATTPTIDRSELGGSKGAHRAPCPRCAKRRLFSTWFKSAPKSAAEFGRFRRVVLPICWVSEFCQFVLPICGVSVIWPIRSADLLGFLGF